MLANNYASVLDELGCRDEARRVIESALADTPAGARWRPALSATAAGIGPAASDDTEACAAAR